MKIIILSMSAAFLLFINSCQEASVYPFIPGGGGSSIAFEDFPNTIGSYWIYHVYDPYDYLSDDTVEVRINGKTITPEGDSAYTWTYFSRNKGFTMEEAVVVKNNQVNIQDFYSEINISYKNYYHFPLDSGKSWTVNMSNMSNENEHCSYTARVLFKDISFGATYGTFHNVYMIEHKYCQLNDQLLPEAADTLFFVPKIGVLLKKETAFSGKYQITWTLLDYNIAK